MTALLIGYARCSTDEQDLTVQREGLAALGVTPDRIYVDHGLTGSNRERPGLREALATCRDGDTRDRRTRRSVRLSFNPRRLVGGRLGHGCCIFAFLLLCSRFADIDSDDARFCYLRSTVGSLREHPVCRIARITRNRNGEPSGFDCYRCLFN